MNRDNFGSKLGILAAAAGSAIGLGNIWKFPYITGQNGGAAFILIYLFCIALIGLPVMIAEFTLGRNTQTNAMGAFKKISNGSKWSYSGYLAVLTSFIILSFYSIIAGWVFAYIARAFSGKLIGVAPAELADYFGGIISSPIEPVFWTFIVLAATALMVVSGVKKGIEKYSKILMPVLLMILVGLVFRSVTLPGASKGLEFLFKPDFSRLTTKGVLEALGHAFYSLSLGMGIILTYGSYIGKKENLFRLAVQVTIADTAIALMAGMVIFPAVFAYGFEPNQGPALIFMTLPAVFGEMPFGGFFEAMFFLLIGIAAMTSTISLIEVVVAFIIEEFNMDRKKATIGIAAGAFLLSIPSTLSFGVWSGVKLFDRTFFDMLDFLASNVFLPIGGILVCLFVGWIWKAKNSSAELESEGLYKFKGKRAYEFAIRYVAPIAIMLILFNSTGLLGKLDMKVMVGIGFTLIGVLFSVSRREKKSYEYAERKSA